MNTYQITVPQIHCAGCVQLIKLSLESEEIKDISVDIATKEVRFTSSLDKEETLRKLTSLFATELAGTDYAFDNLIILN